VWRILELRREPRGREQPPELLGLELPPPEQAQLAPSAPDPPLAKLATLWIRRVLPRGQLVRALGQPRAAPLPTSFKVATPDRVLPQLLWRPIDLAWPRRLPADPPLRRRLLGPIDLGWLPRRPIDLALQRRLPPAPVLAPRLLPDPASGRSGARTSPTIGLTASKTDKNCKATASNAATKSVTRSPRTTRG
jgi:hypothetical protein